MTNTNLKTDGPSVPIAHGVLDAVISQEGERLVHYGNVDGAGWVSLGDLHGSQTEVFRGLGRSNVHLLTNKSREECKRAIENHTEFRPALVARHPGWIANGVYATGDGHFVRRRTNDASEVISAVTPNNRFGVSGTLEEWKAANSPFLQGQPLVHLVYAYALTGYLIEFAPLSFQNPVLEIIGETGKGKTSLAVAAGSICGGLPRNPNGFCLSWDRTNATFDRLERQHRNGLLALNENNLAGADAAAQATFMRTAVMKFTEPGERETMNSIEAPIYSRLALLSTSNSSILELISGNGRSDDAVRSRVVTLYADRPFGIYDVVPAGFCGAGDAAGAMVEFASKFYGVCGRAFIAFLNRCRREAVTHCIEYHLRRLKKRRMLAGTWDERQLKTLALCHAADHLAKMANVFPVFPDSFDDALQILSSEGSLAAPRVRSARETVIDYIRERKDDFVDAATLTWQVTKEVFYRTSGFWIENGKRCVVPPTALRGLPGERRFIKVLKDSGDLESEEGHSTKKVPSAICNPKENCRGYFIRIGLDDL